MDKYLQSAEKIDLTGQDIVNITGGNVSIIIYSDLQDIDNIDNLFEKSDCVAVLYETRKDFGHWTALIKHNTNTIEFFDPYGLQPDEELKYASYNVRKTPDGMLEPHLSFLIKSSNYNFIYNKIKLQRWLPEVNTCGRHIALRIKFKNMSLQEYTRLLTHNRCYDADLWVTALTIAYSI
jgi:hypothetical protein